VVKTEAYRHILTDESCVYLPDDVRKALEVWNKIHSIKLDILWDADSGHWQIYTIKQPGVTKNMDLMHWQMEAPNAGTAITPGIIDWLRKFDTSNGGYLDQDEMRKNWLNLWAKGKDKLKKKQQDEADDRAYGHKDMVHSFTYDGGVPKPKVQIVVPTCVGMNKGKKVYAVPPKRRLIDGN